MVFRLFSLIGVALLAVSCAHHSTPKQDPMDTQGRMEGKMASSLKAMREEYSRTSIPTSKKGKTHSFDKTFNTASAGDRGAMKLLGGRSYHTSDYSGLKNFNGAKSYHVSEFSQANKQSRWGTQTSRYESQSNRMGGETYATKESVFGKKAAHQGSQSFSQGSESFKTGEFQPAAKSIEDNKRPVIDQGKPGEAARNANAFSDDDVRRLLGR